MTNSERYRAAFGHLRAPSDAAQRAAGALEHPTGLRRKGRRHMRPLMAAAAILLVLAGAVGAEASSGEISNLLAPLYGGSPHDFFQFPQGVLPAVCYRPADKVQMPRYLLVGHIRKIR